MLNLLISNWVCCNKSFWEESVKSFNLVSSSAIISKLILTFIESSTPDGVNTYFKTGEISPSWGVESGLQDLSKETPFYEFLSEEL